MKRSRVENAMIAMGIPAGIKGFIYIADAMDVFEERGIGINITKELYPKIARKNETKDSRVERAIRHALDAARNCEGSQEAVGKYIGFANRQNSSSLKMMHMRLKQEEEEEDKLGCRKEGCGTGISEADLRIIIQDELRKFFKESGGVCHESSKT